MITVQNTTKQVVTIHIDGVHVKDLEPEAETDVKDTHWDEFAERKSVQTMLSNGSLKVVGEHDEDDEDSKPFDD